VEGSPWPARSVSAIRGVALGLGDYSARNAKGSETGTNLHRGDSLDRPAQSRRGFIFRWEGALTEVRSRGSWSDEEKSRRRVEYLPFDPLSRRKRRRRSGAIGEGLSKGGDRTLVRASQLHTFGQREPFYLPRKETPPRSGRELLVERNVSRRGSPRRRKS